jgi:hypothetical protein
MPNHSNVSRIAPEAQDLSEVRTLGVQARHNLTDTLKRFIQYAADQGSQNASRYYQNATRSVYYAIGATPTRYRRDEDEDLRDKVNTFTLHTINLAEQVLCEGLEAGMDAGQPYKTVYRTASKKLRLWASMCGFKSTGSKRGRKA